MYVSRVGNENEQKETMEGFRARCGVYPQSIGQTRKVAAITPNLTFKLDTAIADSVRIYPRLLHDLTSTSATDAEARRPAACLIGHCQLG